ncbi:MAG TPA: 1-acyl-sn-glycerol-3-phosphate acyltransferase [Acinetobacter radioresistens]|nr:1-acyl-sn-glycerol-3-phosphate acyltransferase [Acinetobacter radioresistens]
MISFSDNSMSQLSTQPVPVSGLSKIWLYSKKIVTGIALIIEGFYLVYRHRLYKHPNKVENTRYVQYFCRRLGEVFNVEVRIHGTIPRQPALWVSNHISWLDIAVIGSAARVFFLAKAEIEQWPVLGKLAKAGGTLFIKRGSGDSTRIREQLTDFLKQDIPVLFFPEATTRDGSYIKRVYGRLLGAALAPHKPVQIALICYVNQQGKLDTIVPFIDDLTFAEHVRRVLEMPPVTAHLMALPAISVEGHTLESLTAEVQQAMIYGLAELHQNVLKTTAIS